MPKTYKKQIGEFTIECSPHININIIRKERYDGMAYWSEVAIFSNKNAADFVRLVPEFLNNLTEKYIHEVLIEEIDENNNIITLEIGSSKHYKSAVIIFTKRIKDNYKVTEDVFHCHIDKEEIYEIIEFFKEVLAIKNQPTERYFKDVLWRLYNAYLEKDESTLNHIFTVELPREMGYEK